MAASNTPLRCCPMALCWSRGAAAEHWPPPSCITWTAGPDLAPLQLGCDQPEPVQQGATFVCQGLPWRPCATALPDSGKPDAFRSASTLEAQRSGVSGPKPPALSAELRARASRSNRAEWLTSYPAIGMDIERLSGGVLKVAFKRSPASASVSGQFGRRVGPQAIDPLEAVTHSVEATCRLNQSHRRYAIPCRRAPQRVR